MVDGRELEGLEWVPWFFRFAPMMENAAVRPNPVVETAIKTGEISAKVGRNTEALNNGRRIEKQQLEQMGLEKNNKPFEFIDPKTGKSGRTIPDGIDKKGNLVEIKNVNKQSLTKQLRGQLEVAKRNGVDVILRIKEKTELTKPLENSGVKIQRFKVTPPVKMDEGIEAQNRKNNQPVILFPKPKDPCKKNPNCV